MPNRRVRVLLEVGRSFFRCVWGFCERAFRSFLVLLLLALGALLSTIVFVVDALSVVRKYLEGSPGRFPRSEFEAAVDQSRSMLSEYFRDLICELLPEIWRGEEEVCGPQALAS